MRTFHTNKKAFSIIEIMIVLLLLAILITIGIPSLMRGKTSAIIREEVRELKADLEMAKNYAKSGGGGTAKFQWNSPSNNSPGYRVVDTEGVVKKIKTFDVKIYGDFSTWPDTEIEFFNNGTANETGTIQLKAKSSHISLYYKISITKETGMISFTEVN